MSGGTSLQLKLNPVSGYMPSGWWSWDYYDGSGVGIAQVIRLPSALARGRYYQRAPWMPHGVLLGEGSGLQPGQQLQIAATAPPTERDNNDGFTYEIGDIVWNTAASAGARLGWICTTAGTQDTLAGVTTTADDGANEVEVDVTTGLYRGAYVTFATVAGVYKITDLTGLTLTVTPALESSPGVGQAVSYSPAVLAPFGNVDGSVAVSAYAIDWSLGTVFYKTLGAGAQVFTFSNAADGMCIVVEVTGSASTLTWPTVLWPGGVAPTQTASGTDIYTFIQRGSNVFGSVVQDMST